MNTRQFAFFTAFAIFVTAAATGFSQPVINFDQQSVDFGESYPDTDLNHNFVVTNAGTGNLVIQEVRTSCGCTAAIPSATTIPAGATSIISVTMTTNSAPTMHKTATVRSNDPKRPVVQLSLNAKIRQVWKVIPNTSIQLGEVPYGSSKTETIYLKNVDGDKYDIVSTKLIRPEFNHNVKQRTEKGIPIDIVYIAPETEGFVSDTLQIRTNDPRQPLIRVNILAKAVGPIRFNPVRLFFGNVKKGESKSREVTARLYDPQAEGSLQVHELKTNSEFIEGEILEQSADGAVKMKFTFTAPNSIGLKRGTITLKTNNKLQPEAELNYSALVN